MAEVFDVSVVISTYNRSELLASALESVLAQEADGVVYEVIVVDNNSTDRTREVVESFIARGATNLRYVFEGKQGLSHGRNAGIANARAPVIAFTDDDVCAANDWVASIKRAFDQHLEVDCVGGKVLPQWQEPPPAWLTTDHWSPLALVDYGADEFYVSADNRICLVGANTAYRRTVFERLGGFSPDLQRVKDGIGSTEDHDFMRRFWDTGGVGLYVPGSVVTTPVQPERMTKAYHRRWHQGHGFFYALMRSEEMEASRARLFDVPLHLYRQAGTDAGAWLKDSLRGDASHAFRHETRLRFFAGFWQKRQADFRSMNSRVIKPTSTPNQNAVRKEAK